MVEIVEAESDVPGEYDLNVMVGHLLQSLKEKGGKFARIEAEMNDPWSGYILVVEIRPPKKKSRKGKK